MTTIIVNTRAACDDVITVYAGNALIIKVGSSHSEQRELIHVASLLNNGLAHLSATAKPRGIRAADCKQ